MAREVPLNELDEELDQLEYPVDRSTVREREEGVLLQYADGTERLSDVLARTGSERFDSREELSSELFNVLPVEAVGEPGQSEGEG